MDYKKMVINHRRLVRLAVIMHVFAIFVLVVGPSYASEKETRILCLFFLIVSFLLDIINYLRDRFLFQDYDPFDEFEDTFLEDSSLEDED